MLLAAAQGGFPALARVRWPEAVLSGRVLVYARTDDDEAGNKYAGQIRDALTPLGVRVLRLPWEPTP